MTIHEALCNLEVKSCQTMAQVSSVLTSPNSGITIFLFYLPGKPWSPSHRVNYLYGIPAAGGWELATYSGFHHILFLMGLPFF
jgi:hypothetical protein